MADTNKKTMNQSVTAESFRTRFRNLIILTWTGPPIVGLSFLFHIRMFSGDQMVAIIKAPLENLFVVGSLIFCVWYFNRYMQPMVRLLDSDDSTLIELAVKRIRRFPLHYWSLFLIYLVIAPSTVIVSAEWFTDFVASPVDWFRIHLVALIVSIIVGLPIFFLILDLFGKVMGPIGLEKPHFTIKAKVFMIGALVPLLIDTMLVQYYWTRTGYFSFETFVVWLGLELLAIGGSIIFVHSFGQSLRPLQNLSEHKLDFNEQKIDLLRPQSTDELGVLATNYRTLIDNWRINNKILQMNTRILRTSGSASSLAEMVDDIIRVCEEVIGDDMVFLILQSESGDELIGVAQTDGPYNSDGYFRMSMDETSMAVWISKHGEPAIINDVENDQRVSDRMRRQFNVKSAIGVPLKVGDEVIGVLMTIGQKVREYSRHERMLLEGIAREAAIAVQTYQLHQQRMSAELARQDNEELLHLIMLATEEGIYGVDIHGQCIFINPAGLKLLGYDNEDELLGKNIHELIHHSFPDGSHYPKQQCQVKRATQQGQSGHSDREMHWRKDGTGFPSEYWSHPIYKEGKIAGTVVTFIDITERMKTMEKIRYQAQVIEQIKDSIIATDLEGNVTSWNKGAENLFGYSEVFMLGRHISCVYPEEELPTLNKLVNTLKLQGVHETEVRVRRQDGSDFYAQMSLSMLSDDNDRPVGMIGYSIDITEQKANQEAIWHQAHYDKLTDLPNRWLLQDRISQNIAIACRDNRQGAVMFLDLDRFKKINDTLGHDFGDEVLLVVSRRLSEMVRDGDTLARLGGDEFVMLLTNLHDI
ncbi:MAG: PAS domain S-box protein, partial [Gammaproteobacteria bacterium]